jgi:serine protease Do
MTHSRLRHLIVSFAFAGSIANVTSVPPAAAQPRAATSSADLRSALEGTARIVGPSVVQIFTMAFGPGEGVVPRTADLVTPQRASGSGVIVDPDGYIVTNGHVVRGAQRVRVEVPVPVTGRSIMATRSRTVAARIVGIDLETDLAVIKIDGSSLPALPFGDSDELNPGQVVLACGSPLGLQNSVSLGVVSAVARQLTPESPMIYVQTDASINPGSSGGPLVDLRGRIVGINTLIMSQSGGNDGLGFAAPSNIVRTVYDQIKAHGRVRRGDIGVRAQTITPVLAAGLALARTEGAVIADVTPDGEGGRAGLRPGDVVLTLDGRRMENGRQFQVGLYRRLPGDIVTLEVLREGRTLRILVAMSERRDPIGDLSTSIDPRHNLVARLGILGVDVTPPIADALQTLRVRSGVAVASTVAEAIDSKEGGLAPGDVVFAINNTPINDLAMLRGILDGLRIGDPVVLQLERRGELMYLAFTIE